MKGRIFGNHHLCCKQVQRYIVDKTKNKTGGNNFETEQCFM